MMRAAAFRAALLPPRPTYARLPPPRLLRSRLSRARVAAPGSLRGA
jgi:hypothetical protein